MGAYRNEDKSMERKEYSSDVVGTPWDAPYCDGCGNTYNNCCCDDGGDEDRDY